MSDLVGNPDCFFSHMEDLSKFHGWFPTCQEIQEKKKKELLEKEKKNEERIRRQKEEHQRQMDEIRK